MVVTGPVRLFPWVRPYYRDTLHHVRRAKDLPLLACLLSMVFPQFEKYASGHDYVVDSLMTRDCLSTIIPRDRTKHIRHFAMPCVTTTKTYPWHVDFDPSTDPTINWVNRADNTLPPDPEPLRCMDRGCEDCNSQQRLGWVCLVWAYSYVCYCWCYDL